MRTSRTTKNFATELAAALDKLLPPEVIAAAMASLPFDAQKRIAAVFAERPVRHTVRIIKRKRP